MSSSDNTNKTSPETNEKFHATCEKALLRVITKNPKIHTLLDSIEALGCQLPKDFFACRPCDQEISGGFVVGHLDDKPYQPQVIVCENKPMEIETFENTIVHELVHAYDVCRSKIDFTNCLQHACTEVRASAISGECGILHEAFRGHFKLHGGHQDCVKRRATLSLQMNPACQSVAAKAVEQAFQKCYSDSSPFEE